MSRGAMVCSQASSVATTSTVAGLSLKNLLPLSNVPCVTCAIIHAARVDLPSPSYPASRLMAPSTRHGFHSHGTGLILIPLALVRLNLRGVSADNTWLPEERLTGTEGTGAAGSPSPYQIRSLQQSRSISTAL